MIFKFAPRPLAILAKRWTPVLIEISAFGNEKMGRFSGVFRLARTD